MAGKIAGGVLGDARQRRGETLLRIVGDALNPIIDALQRNGNIDFVHVRNEEYDVLAAVAEAYLTAAPVAVCETAELGVVH